MTEVKFMQGTAAALDSVPYNDGCVYFLTDGGVFI